MSASCCTEPPPAGSGAPTLTRRSRRAAPPKSAGLWTERPACAIREATIAASLKMPADASPFAGAWQAFLCIHPRANPAVLGRGKAPGSYSLASIRRWRLPTAPRGLEAHSLFQTSCRLRCHSAYLRLRHRGICLPVAFCRPRFANCAMAAGSLRRQTRGSANFASRRALADKGRGFLLRVRLGMRCPFAVRGKQLYPRFVPNSPLCQCLRHRLV